MLDQIRAWVSDSTVANGLKGEDKVEVNFGNFCICITVATATTNTYCIHKYMHYIKHLLQLFNWREIAKHISSMLKNS